MKKYLLLAALALCLGALNTPSTQAQTNNNTIYACYHKENGQLRKVSGPGQCKNSEIPINWNVAGVPGPQGPQGPQGPKGETGGQGQPGQSVTSEVIPVGDARCANGVGGVQYTDSTGIRVVCNGQQGAQGAQGERGPQGDKGDPAALTCEAGYTYFRGMCISTRFSATTWINAAGVCMNRDARLPTAAEQLLVYVAFFRTQGAFLTETSWTQDMTGGGNAVIVESSNTGLGIGELNMGQSLGHYCVRPPEIQTANSAGLKSSNVGDVKQTEPTLELRIMPQQ